MFLHENFDSESGKMLIKMIEEGRIEFRDDHFFSIPIEDQTESGFYIPNKHSKDDNNTVCTKSKIIGIGAGDWNRKGIFEPAQLKIGDVVILPRAYTMRLTINGKFYYVSAEKNVIAVVED